MKCETCNKKFERLNNFGPPPKFCPACRIKRISDQNKAWWKKNPGLSTQYYQDNRRRPFDAKR
jgi:hypothetical protein